MKNTIFIAIVSVFLLCCDREESSKTIQVQLVNGSSSIVDSVTANIVIKNGSRVDTVERLPFKAVMKAPDTLLFRYNLENTAYFKNEGAILFKFYQRNRFISTNQRVNFSTGVVRYFFRVNFLGDTVQVCLPKEDFTNFPTNPYRCQ